MKDGDLVARLVQKDEAAFRALVERMHPLFLRLARTFVRDPRLVDEIAQDTWIAIVRGLPTFEGRSSLRTWACRILINTAKTKAVREQRHVPLEEPPDSSPDRGRFGRDGAWAAGPKRIEPETPEALLERREVRALIDRAIEDLPETQRAVLTLRDLEGWASDEVCNVLDISATNERVLLHRARQKLRAALERELGVGAR